MMSKDEFMMWLILKDVSHHELVKLVFISNKMGEITAQDQVYIDCINKRLDYIECNENDEVEKELLLQIRLHDGSSNYGMHIAELPGPGIDCRDLRALWRNRVYQENNEIRFNKVTSGNPEKFRKLLETLRRKEEK